MDILALKKTANEVRKGIVTAVHSAKSGHPGGSLSAADLLTYLYFEEMNIDPKEKPVTMYTQEDVDQLDDDETRRATVLSSGYSN